jgi:hypothetical protein
MCNNDAYPWAENPEMKDALETAGWRFANLIGATKWGDDGIQFLEIDKKTHPHLVYVQGTTPLWDWDVGVDFVHSLTGYDKSICEQWMDFDWG